MSGGGNQVRELGEYEILVVDKRTNRKLSLPPIRGRLAAMANRIGPRRLPRFHPEKPDGAKPDGVCTLPCGAPLTGATGISHRPSITNARRLFHHLRHIVRSEVGFGPLPSRLRLGQVVEPIGWCFGKKMVHPDEE